MRVKMFISDAEVERAVEILTERIKITKAAYKRNALQERVRKLIAVLKHTNKYGLIKCRMIRKM